MCAVQYTRLASVLDVVRQPSMSYIRWKILFFEYIIDLLPEGDSQLIPCPTKHNNPNSTVPKVARPGNCCALYCTHDMLLPVVGKSLQPLIEHEWMTKARLINLIYCIHGQKALHVPLPLRWVYARATHLLF